MHKGLFIGLLPDSQKLMAVALAGGVLGAACARAWGTAPQPLKPTREPSKWQSGQGVFIEPDLNRTLRQRQQTIGEMSYGLVDLRYRLQESERQKLAWSKSMRDAAGDLAKEMDEVVLDVRSELNALEDRNKALNEALARAQAQYKSQLQTLTLELKERIKANDALMKRLEPKLTVEGTSRHSR